MDSFEGLGLGPELVEALAAEGIEIPTPIQEHAVPVLRRGNSALLRAGAGAGVLVAYGSALLDRLPAEAGAPSGLVLTPTRRRADALARSLARLAAATGHRVAALGAPWALPSHADVLFARPADLLHAIREARVKLDGVQAVVVDGAGAVLDEPGGQSLEPLLDALPQEPVQWVLVGDPLGESVRSFAEARLPRAVVLPPEAAAETEESSPVERGTVEARVVGPRKAEEMVAFVDEALGHDHRHVVLFFRTDDDAADGGDLLALHGYLAAPPGAPDAPVWIATDAMSAREPLRAARENGVRVAVASVDVPPDGDTLDRRHGGAGTGTVFVHPRELPHLRRIASSAGYTVTVRPDERDRTGDEVAAFLARIEEAIEQEDLGPYLAMLEPLLERRGAAEVAAALAAVLRRRAPAGEPVSPGTAARPNSASAGGERPTGAPPQTWVKLFLSVGRKDGVGPGDLVGAITGEAGVQGGQVGRVDIRETFARVEVEEEVAERVIAALNGVTVRGRSVRADYDRPEGRDSRSGARGPRSGPPRGRGGGAPRKGNRGS